AAVVLAFASGSTDAIFRGPLGWTPVAKLRIWARPLLSPLRPRIRAERIERFTHDDDRATTWPNHVARDAGYLNWRYVDSPKGYQCFRAGEGYAVLGHKRQRGRPIALIADLAAAEPVPLLRACVAEARRGSRALFALPAPEHRVVYAKLGFVPTPWSLN